MEKINENVKKIRKELSPIYEKFFKDLNINHISGLTKDGNKRFATYAYIGSKYGDKKKILFIGLDIGKDEPLNEELAKEKKDLKYGIQDFEKRRISIERITKHIRSLDKNNKNREGHNPHISGTMIHAGNILKLNPKKEEFNNEDYSKGYVKHLDIIKFFEKDNPLSYVAILNLRKFVDKEKQDRKQIKFLYPQEEKELLYKEVEKINPDIIILQSTQFKNQKKFKNKLKEYTNSIYYGYHPAYRDRKRTLNNLLRTYKQLL